MTDPQIPQVGYQRVDTTLWRRVFDEVLLFPEGADEPISVTKPGALVWELLVEPSSITELAEQVAWHFSVPVGQVHSDIVGLVGELVTAGAVTVQRQ